MIETRIDLPDAPAEVLKLVEAADVVLHEWAENSQGLTYTGVWSADGSAPVTKLVRLTVRQGPDEISHTVPVSTLTEPNRARDAVSHAIGDVVRKGYRRTADALLAVIEEIKADHASDLEPVGR